MKQGVKPIKDSWVLKSVQKVSGEINFLDTLFLFITNFYLLFKYMSCMVGVNVSFNFNNIDNISYNRIHKDWSPNVFARYLTLDYLSFACATKYSCNVES